MTYKNPAGNEFPVIAQAPIPQKFLDLFSSDPEERKIQAAQYQSSFEAIANSLKACGFNVSLFGSAFEIMDAMADACDKAGTNVILNPVWLNDDPEHAAAVLEHYKDKRQPVAWQVFDQPKFFDWGNAYASGAPSVPVWNNLTVGLRMAREIDTKRMAYFNLAAPQIDGSHPVPKEWLGSCTDYSEYLDILEKLYHPAVWSYDLYPFIIDSDTVVTDGHPADVKFSHFYGYLKKFLEHSRATGAPFWAYCMCLGHTYWKNIGTFRNIVWRQPAPTEGMLRFEAFNALAFGAQGIVYWQYGQPFDDLITKSGFSYSQGPFDFSVEDGEGGVKILTPKESKDRILLNEAIKAVNTDIQKYAEVFLGCKVTRASFYGKIYPDNELKDMVFDFPCGCLDRIVCGEDGVVVSEITNGDTEDTKKNYFVIVNQNPFADQAIRITIRPGYKGTVMTDAKPTKFAISDTPSIIPGTDIGHGVSPKNYKRILPAGGCLIIEWAEYHNSSSGWEPQPIDPSFP